MCNNVAVGLGVPELDVDNYNGITVRRVFAHFAVYGEVLFKDNARFIEILFF